MHLELKRSTSMTLSNEQVKKTSIPHKASVLLKHTSVLAFLPIGVTQLNFAHHLTHCNPTHKDGSLRVLLVCNLVGLTMKFGFS